MPTFHWCFVGVFVKYSSPFLLVQKAKLMLCKCIAVSRKMTFFFLFWLFGWLVGWLVGCLVGFFFPSVFWLVGWLKDCLFVCFSSGVMVVVHTMELRRKIRFS